MSAVSEIMPSKHAVTILVNRSAPANRPSQDHRPTAHDATMLMLKKKVGSVIVVDYESGEPIGIVTERDLLRKVSSQNRRAKEVALAKIMSSPLVTVRSYDSIETAAKVMTKNKVKRLIVLDADNSFSGVLSVSDISKNLIKIITDDQKRYQSLKNMLNLE